MSRTLSTPGPAITNRACMSCRHGRVFYSPATGQVADCHHPVMMRTDHVFGINRPTLCSEARSIGHRCGPMGMCYEAPPPMTTAQRQATYVWNAIGIVSVVLVLSYVAWLVIQFRAGVHP